MTGAHDDAPIRATPKDWRAIADITFDAFQDDPVTSWIFGSDRVMATSFNLLARRVYSQRGLCEVIGDEGATQWMPPGASKELPTLAKLSMVASIWRSGGRSAINRILEAGEIMAQHQPKTPHFYLFTIGVRQSSRGKGLGHKLLSGVLAQCDSERTPVYLENSKPENHGFYARHGFERMEIFHPGDGAPPMEAMWREPI